LTQKIQCQLIPSTIAPPITGPNATASPAIAPHIPIAAPRFSTGNASLISVSQWERDRGTRPLDDARGDQ
jgi:hypothetical protein